MTTPSEAVAASLARKRGAAAPERCDRAAAVQLIHELDAAGIVVGRRTPPASPALTWAVARVIHRRCCDAACSGAHEHLPAAAVAVDLLLPRRRPAASPPAPGRLSTVA